MITDDATAEKVANEACTHRRFKSIGIFYILYETSLVLVPTVTTRTCKVDYLLIIFWHNIM